MKKFWRLICRIFGHLGVYEIRRREDKFTMGECLYCGEKWVGHVCKICDREKK